VRDLGETNETGKEPAKGGTRLPWAPIKSAKQSEEGYGGIAQPTGATLPESADKPPGRERAK